ncbi:uncharacterized protein THITE_2141916 [Thermothielavioides terrestris NRRL 8126]|uniref:Aminoglycoside phosphotransferase domain-containing protein n=1 Tax=Thermothielavioides terrestris (strain ATCC 38088 / NRRL 8126) TaxID=578455 RepID=G2QWF8_THETT|nr:uncharacterized protein THITE_2141916 [Thermothielavioides terrestris NRRL 8126]AEO63933.1 hypothetical protein THITE_2141916 [Thermothielavioides terrestris NRRL 8126]
MLAKGVRVPDSPPPPPRLVDQPLVRKLLEAGGTVISEKTAFSCLVKHACGTRVTKFYRSGIRRSEVEAIRFVSEHTSIPVPRVYDVGDQHFTMEFIEGETLPAAWDRSLSAQDRALVIRQLRDYIGQLRALKSPDGVICSFGGRPAAFNDFLVSDIVGHAKVRDMIRSQMRADHEIVLTHGDLHGINILVRPGIGVVAIVDWELAGYYPEYLDLLRLFRTPDWSCGYYSALLDIFPKSYDAEFVVDQAITHWSGH